MEPPLEVQFWETEQDKIHVFLLQIESTSSFAETRGDRAQNSASNGTKKSTSTTMEIQQDNRWETIWFDVTAMAHFSRAELFTKCLHLLGSIAITGDRSLVGWLSPNSITPTSPKLPRTGKFRVSRRNGIWVLRSL